MREALDNVAGTTLLIDDQWRFMAADDVGNEAPELDDTDWSQVNVPHDWAFESDYAEDAGQGDRGGYKPGGIGWYRKAFEMPAAWVGKRVEVIFDGVYMNSEVWVNGQLLGKRPFGYITFGYDLTDHIAVGRNTIAVRVDNECEPSARWYHGCGIYAHVHLVVTDPVHIPRDGVSITTPQVTDESAEVVVRTEVANSAGSARGVKVKTTLFGADGCRVAMAADDCFLETGQVTNVTQNLTVTEPMLWDITAPNLYQALTRIIVDGDVVDEVTTRFGIRSIRWEVETGFWLNGRNVKLLGVCEHLEGGPVGAAFPDELIRWKIQLLQDMGCNAIRTAHNPQVPRFYELCDEMGMLVMDEIFDGWQQKATHDYGAQAFDDWWERDVRDWIKRDRNHPCVIIWSVGNETKGEIAADLVRVCHEVDPSRLVTSGSAEPGVMDVEGLNGPSENMRFFEANIGAPRTKPFVSTEAPHTWQTRDFYRTQTWYRDGYPNDRVAPFSVPDLTEEEIFTYDWTTPGNKANRKQHFNSSYDNATVRISSRRNWQYMRDLPWLSGHFRWTGFDYLGEAGFVHGGWPFRIFMGGPLDTAGFKKDLYYFYQSQWTTEPMVHILPHWTHPRMEVGTLIPVWVYSNCDEVELLFNGESLGRKKPGTDWDKMQCEWMVPWAPGRVEAVGYRRGIELVRARQETAGAPARLALSVEGDACPIVTVVQVDDNGVRNPYAENRIHYHLNGPARILSLEGGNPVNTENNFGTTSRAAFFGKTRAFLQATDGDISLLAGAICGDKKLMVSNVVTIDLASIDIRGESDVRTLTIRYSVDGSEPTTPYDGPFSVAPDTTVRADVLEGGKLLFSMSERFGPDEGLYWGDGTEAVVAGDQAEDAELYEAIVSTAAHGFHGKGFVVLQREGSYIEWYQENDGGAGRFDVAIRYCARAEQGHHLKLSVNGEVIVSELFFPPGDGWQAVSATIRLREGANTIRLSAINANAPYIDEIIVQ